MNKEKRRIIRKNVLRSSAFFLTNYEFIIIEYKGNAGNHFIIKKCFQHSPVTFRASGFIR